MRRKGMWMKIERTCRTCFGKTSGCCSGNKSKKCRDYEIDYNYFNDLYTRARESASEELSQEFFDEHKIGVYDFIERALQV